LALYSHLHWPVSVALVANAMGATAANLRSSGSFTTASATRSAVGQEAAGTLRGVDTLVIGEVEVVVKMDEPTSSPTSGHGSVLLDSGVLDGDDFPDAPPMPRTPSIELGQVVSSGPSMRNVFKLI